MTKKQANQKISLKRSSRRSFTTLIAVVVTFAVIGGYWALKSSHADTPPVKICNVQSSSATPQCLATFAPGALVWADSDTHTATWTQMQVGVGTTTSYEFQNASGNCLTLQNNVYNKANSHYATMSKGACAPSNPTERWTVSQISPFTITNLEYGCSLHVPAKGVVVDCSFDNTGTSWIYKIVD